MGGFIGVVHRVWDFFLTGWTRFFRPKGCFQGQKAPKGRGKQGFGLKGPSLNTRGGISFGYWPQGNPFSAKGSPQGPTFGGQHSSPGITVCFCEQIWPTGRVYPGEIIFSGTFGGGKYPGEKIENRFSFLSPKVPPEAQNPG